MDELWSILKVKYGQDFPHSKIIQMGLGTIQQKEEEGLGSECRHVIRDHSGKTTVDQMDSWSVSNPLILLKLKIFC